MNSNSSIFWLTRVGISVLLWRRNSLILIFLLFQLGGIFAQSVSIKGKVVAVSNDVTGVAVQNLSTRRATITDFEGNFSIRASVGDTLVFSAVQFKNKLLPITQAISTTSFVLVPLEPFVNELREVVVQPYGLSGDLDRDLGGLALEQAVDEEALGLPNAGKPHPTQSERLLAEANGGAWSLGAGAIGAGTGVPLNPIINAITGRTKMLKNRVKIDRTYSRTRQVQGSIADSIFQVEFKIPASNIDDFMYFCEVDQQFQQLVQQGDQLKLWDYLIERSKAYRRNNGLE